MAKTAPDSFLCLQWGDRQFTCGSSTFFV